MQRILGRALASLGLCLSLLSSLSLAAGLQNLAVGGYTLTSSRRVTRTDWEYTYKANVTNSGGNQFLGVNGTLTSRSPNTVVVDGGLSFGDVPPTGAVPSADTFTIRQNRSFPFTWDDLGWTLSGNIPPTASFTATPQSGEAPLPVRFDALASSDPDGTIAGYQWDFGDGLSGSGAATSHTYQTPGTYNATLSVTDNEGVPAVQTLEVQVMKPSEPPPPPEVAGISPAEGPSGTLVSLHGSGFTRGSSVVFGETPAAKVIFLSDKELAAFVPFATIEGSLAPLPDQWLEIRVDGASPQSFHVTALPQNPAPAGAVLQNAFSRISQTLSDGLAEDQATLEGLQGSTIDPNVKNLLGALSDILPDLQASLAELPASLQQSLDPTTLSTLERVLLHSDSMRQSLGTVRPLMQPNSRFGSEAGTLLDGDIWLQSRKPYVIVADALTMLDAFITMAEAVSLSMPPTLPALVAVASIVHGLLVSLGRGAIEEVILDANVGKLAMPDLYVLLVQKRDTFLSASIKVRSEVGVDTLYDGSRTLADVITKLPQALDAKLKHLIDPIVTLVELSGGLPSIKIGPESVLPISFSNVESLPLTCKGSSASTVECIGELGIDGTSGRVLPDPNNETVAESVWSFGIDPSLRLITEALVIAGVHFVHPPALSVGPIELVLNSNNGYKGTLSVQYKNTNFMSGSSNFDWSATTSSAKITLSPSQGPPENANIEVFAGTTGLAPGSYKETITVDAPGANSSPQLVAVNVQINGDETNAIAHWPFDEGGGATAADTAGGHNGVVSGATYIQGKKGNALWFDGTNDYVSVPHSTDFDLNKFTVAAWIRPDSAQGNYAQVVGKWWDNHQEHNFYLGWDWNCCWVHPFRILIYETQRQGYYHANYWQALRIGEWFHAAGTYDGLLLKLYINGTLVESTQLSGTPWIGQGSIGIGAQVDGPIRNFFGGAIDEVYIYDRALSQEEVTALYSGGNGN